MKIYIVGPSGSGKTTLAKKLSNQNKIPYYELDCIVYDDLDNHRKRTDKEINDLWNKILKRKNWIIEDVGRSRFEKGLEESNIIYYLKISKIEVYKRVILRWIKQRLGREPYNYPPTIYQFFDMLKTAKSYFTKETEKLKRLEKYQDKVKYLSKKELNNLISEK